MNQKILIVDDDHRLAEMLVSYLEPRGFEAVHAATGTSGITASQRGDFDAIILDVMLPDIEGFEVCKKIRAASDVPIIMLTARGDELDRIVGLEIGADDYLSKPFNPRELLARLKAILRRRGPADASTLRFGALEIDVNARTVTVDGEPKSLTGRQFDLLRVLAERAGRVQSREQLMRAVSGESLEAFDRSIDVHISRIRAAIEPDAREPTYILSIRGAGYMLAVPDMAI